MRGAAPGQMMKLSNRAGNGENYPSLDGRVVAFCLATHFGRGKISSGRKGLIHYRKTSTISIGR
jgi:hypothetical protein